MAIAGTRPSAVTAAAHATINRLAPGRVFCGIGTGNTAMRIMGHKPIGIAEFDRYLGELRSLMDGEETVVRWRGKSAVTRHLMPDSGSWRSSRASRSTCRRSGRRRWRSRRVTATV